MDKAKVGQPYQSQASASSRLQGRRGNALAGHETLVRAESGTTLKDMSLIKSTAAVAIIVLLAACNEQVAFTDPTPRATALPGRFAPYVGPGKGWGGPTVS